VDLTLIKPRRCPQSKSVLNEGLCKAGFMGQAKLQHELSKWLN